MSYNIQNMYNVLHIILQTVYETKKINILLVPTLIINLKIKKY